MITRRQLFTWWRHVPAPAHPAPARAPRPAAREVAPALATRVITPIAQVDDVTVGDPPATTDAGFSLETFYAARARARR